MSQGNEVDRSRPSTTAIVATVAVAVGVAVACFTAVAILPASDKPFFDSPLRGLVTGLGLLGVACPLCIAGFLLRRHAAGSPYFEEAFIAGVLNLFGYVCLALAVVCFALAVYALVHRLVAGG